MSLPGPPSSWYQRIAGDSREGIAGAFRFVCGMLGLWHGCSLTVLAPGKLRVQCDECKGHLEVDTMTKDPPVGLVLVHGPRCLTGFRASAVWN